ncbi:hypothetical protein ABLO26_22895, partial [Neobacillus sp. 179-J 1A1 HS]
QMIGIRNLFKDFCDLFFNSFELCCCDNNLKAINKSVLSHIMKNFIPNRTIEYNDNRISKFIAQYGKCTVTGAELGISDWHCHHINPYHLSKDDSYLNLIVLQEAVHRLVHLKDIDKIKSLLRVLHLNNKQKEKVNELRKLCNNYTI